MPPTDFAILQIDIRLAGAGRLCACSADRRPPTCNRESRQCHNVKRVLVAPRLCPMRCSAVRHAGFLCRLRRPTAAPAHHHRIYLSSGDCGVPGLAVGFAVMMLAAAFSLLAFVLAARGNGSMRWQRGRVDACRVLVAKSEGCCPDGLSAEGHTIVRHPGWAYRRAHLVMQGLRRRRQMG